MSIAVGLAGSTLAIWVYLMLARGGYWRLDDGPSRRETPPAWPEVQVVIPARNEAEHIARTVESLRAQAYPGPLSITVVDDQSADETAALALQAGANVISGQPLPAGWTGKLWALKQGLQAIQWRDRPGFVLFTDADIEWRSPTVLSDLVSEALASGLVLNSRMVRLRCDSPAEAALIPAFVYFFRQLYPFRWINDPKRDMAGGAGGCMLLDHAALIRAGGVESVRTALIDDCTLAARMKAQGPVRLALTDAIDSLRPYPQIADIRAMVVRSAYAQLGYSRINLAGCLLGLALTYMAPPLLTLFAQGPARWMGAAAWMLMTLSYLPMLRFYGLAPWRALTLPAIAATYAAFTLESALQHERGRGGMWKGRVQAIDGSRQ